MNKSLLITAAVNVALFSVLGTSQVWAYKELSVSQELAPMPKPKPYKVGRQWHYIENGKEGMSTFIAQKGEEFSYEDTDGCKFTVRGFKTFSPAVKWSGCKSADGKHFVKFKGGTIWPLKVGNKFKYWASGNNNNGDSWTLTRKCKVKEQVRVKTISGEYDTYKVICDDKYATRTWWVSPTLNATVLYKNVHIRRGARVQEMTRIVD